MDNTKPPSPEQEDRIRSLSVELDDLLKDLNTIIEKDAPHLNQLMNRNDVSLVDPGQRIELLRKRFD
jgi:hypothetical protein